MSESNCRNHLGFDLLCRECLVASLSKVKTRGNFDPRLHTDLDRTDHAIDQARRSTGFNRRQSKRVPRFALCETADWQASFPSA